MNPNENQLSRYGAFSRGVPGNVLSPGSKLFLVADSDDTTAGAVNIAAAYPPDKDGVVRVYTTIQAAVNAAAGGRGDVVGVLPGYDHTLGRADSWSTAGVQVIGFGNGLNRPTLRYTTATDEVGVGASNVRVSNLRFLAAVDSCARALDFDTAFSGAKLDNCVFDYNATGNDFRVSVRLGQPKSVIEDNFFGSEADTAGSGRGISISTNADYSVIQRNKFVGMFDTVGDTTNGAAAIAIDTVDVVDANLLGVFIDNNLFVSTDTAVGAAMRLLGGGITMRGIISNNRVVSYDSAGTDTVIFATGGFLSGHNTLSRTDTTEKIVGETAVKYTDSGN